MQKTDRYVTFKGIDCDGNARRLVAHMRRHIDDPARSNRFWEQFKARLEPGHPLRQDELFLVHASINVIRELFEQYDDAEGLALLQQLEEECC